MFETEEQNNLLNIALSSFESQVLKSGYPIPIGQGEDSQVFNHSGLALKAYRMQKSNTNFADQIKRYAEITNTLSQGKYLYPRSVDGDDVVLEINPILKVSYSQALKTWVALSRFVDGDNLASAKLPINHKPQIKSIFEAANIQLNSIAGTQNIRLGAVNVKTGVWEPGNKSLIVTDLCSRISEL